MVYRIYSESWLKKVLEILLFLLPWQTIWITHEKFLNGIKWEYGTIGFYATEGLLWLAVMLFIVWFWKKKELHNYRIKELSLTKDRVFVLSVFAFLLYCFLGIIWSFDRDVAWQHAFRLLEAVLLFFVLFLGPLKRETGMKWFIAGATVQSILGIWQFLSQSTFSSTILGMPLHDPVVAGTSVVVIGIERWLRAYGALPHPNVFGGYLAVSLACTGFLLWNRERGACIGALQKYRMMILLFLSAVLQATALFFTFSRSAWISFAIVFLVSGVFVFLQKKDILFHLAVATTAVMLAVIFHPLVTGRATINSPSEFISIQERVSGYEEAKQLFFQRPWVGVGSGNYTLAAYTLNPNRPGWSYQPVHNVLLLFLVEEGIVGCLLAIGIGVAFFNYLRSAHTDHKWPIIHYSLFIILSLAPILLVDHYLYSSYVGLLLLSLGLAWCPQSVHTSSTDVIS